MHCCLIIEQNSMDKLQSGGDSGGPLNIIVIDESDDSQIHNPFQKLRKYSGNLFNQEPFEDDQFKLPEERLPKGVVRKRLRDIYPKDTPIGEGLYGEEEQGEGGAVGLSKPSYLCELRMLPQWHYLSLIQPRSISEQGYYYVAVVQGGRIAKLVVDDFIYYDEVRGEIQAHPFLLDRPWVHIILKAWAKLNQGYDRLDSAPPFAFLKAFSFPDWGVFNPGLQDLQTVISRISASNKNEYYLVCKTKSDPIVGQFGLVPNSAGYQITGYHQEYGNVFLKVRSYAGGKWNGCYQDKDYQRPTEHIPLSKEEFMIPLRTFINIFHLIYFTTNKYSRRHRLHYNKYTLSLDARQSKATFIRLQLQGGESMGEQQTNINFHFPSVKASDYGNQKVITEGESCPPSVKICIGRLIQQVNLQGSLSYAQSIRENILKNEQGYFLNPANSKYEHVWSDNFTGYSNDATYHLKLRPGKYIIRLKVEKLLPQYRALLNITSSADSMIGECKMNKREQTTFLSEVLSNRARREQRNVIQPFPHKKQSWIMANDDFQAIGYGTLTFQTGKNDNMLMVVSVDTKKLKKGGYRIKNKMELQELSNEIRLKQGESVILILKRDVQFKGEWQWPPEGITISYEPVTPKTKHKPIN